MTENVFGVPWQVAGDGQQVPPLGEWLPAEQWLVAGVQLLGFLELVPPGGGLMDPLGTHRQRLGRGPQEEGEAAESKTLTPAREALYWYVVVVV